jgi:hypothetical protein
LGTSWVLAIFAVVAARIGLRTLGKIRDQTEAAVEALNIGRMAADAAKRSAETAQRDLKLNARAQIVVRVVEPINGLSTEFEPVVIVHLVNIGRTPAYHAHYESWIDILEHPFNGPKAAYQSNQSWFKRFSAFFVLLLALDWPISGGFVASNTEDGLGVASARF